MRKQVTGHVCAVLKGILFIGFSIQIVFGLIWMCLNFATVAQFPEHESIAYRGLYTLVGRNAPILYLLQLCTAFFAGWRLLNTLRAGKNWHNIWGSLGLLTFPMAMQTHMAVLPWSFAGSLLMLQWSFGVQLLRCCENRKQPSEAEAAAGTAEEMPGKPGRLDVVTEKDGWKCAVGMGVCWLLAAVFLPEYGWFGAVPVVVVLVRQSWQLRKKRRQLLRVFLLTIGFACLAAGAGAVAKKASGMPDRSIAFYWMSRTVWSSFWADHYGWPDEIEAALGEELWTVSLEADNMDRVFRPLMEQHFGAEQADSYYRILADNSWTHRTSAILSQMSWDAVGYGATPVVLQRQLQGDGYESYSGRNYEVMRNQAPLLTKYYLDYACWWFCACVVVAVLTAILLCLREKRFLWRDIKGAVVMFVLTAMVLVTVYTMRGACMMDYKMSFAVSSLWLLLAQLVMREEGSLERR